MPSPPIRPLLLTVILAGLFCRLMFVFFTPTFYAPDELAHFNYIQYLAEHRSFPVMTHTLGDPANEWEFPQPPLFYLLMVPFFAAAKAAALPLVATVRLLRGCAILLWGLNLWLGVGLLKRLEIKDRFIWVFLLAMASLLPTYTFVSSAINNDNLLATWSGGLLCLLVRRETTLKNSAALGLLLGFALLTKKSAVVFMPAFALAALWDGFSHPTRWSAVLVHLGLAFGLALLMYVPWAVRDWHVYGTLNPEFLTVPRKVWPSPMYGIASAVHNLVKTFWAVSGVSNEVGYPLPLPGMLLLLLASLPLPAGLKDQRSDEISLGHSSPMVMVVFLFVVLITSLLALRVGYGFGMGQGRHLFPLLFPIALLLAMRLRRLPLKNLEWWAAGFWVAYGVAFLVFSLCRFPSHYAVPGV